MALAISVSAPQAAAALVVSGNRTFASPGPRKELEAWLDKHQSEFWDSWRRPGGQ